MIYVLILKFLRENFILNMLSGFIFYKRIYPAVLFIKKIKKNRYKIGLHFMVLSYKKNDSI